MQLNRRHFNSGLTAAAFASLSSFSSLALGAASIPTHKGYGALVPDPDGLIDLPEGFSYRVLSELGQTMADGYAVPDRADGMGSFALPDGKIALVRNHELAPNHLDTGPFINAAPPADNVYDMLDGKTPLVGGTTTLIIDAATMTMERQHLSLVGTIRNCAGGTTPWGTWLTCEENTAKAGERIARDHGYVFEVPATATGLVKPVPLKAMGRFIHEAAAVDPRTGIVYLTEDRGDSLFYRFIPNEPGNLIKGGKLQALAFADADENPDTRNQESQHFVPGEWKFARWIDIENPESPEDDLRMQGAEKGAALFARGEGIHFGDNELYFCCTSGGAAKEGQIMRYRPSRYEGQDAESTAPGLLQLFLESTDRNDFSYGDNLTIAPNGHLIVCEDQYSDTVDNHLRGVNGNGEVYALGRIRIQTEPAGACFSPDGKTMFLNLYSPTRTIAITGPW